MCFRRVSVGNIFVNNSATFVSVGSQPTRIQPAAHASLTVWKQITLCFLLSRASILDTLLTTLSLSPNIVAGPEIGIPNMRRGSGAVRGAFEGGNVGAVDKQGSIRIINSDGTVANEIVPKDGLKFVFVWSRDAAVQGARGVSGGDLAFGKLFLLIIYSL